MLWIASYAHAKKLDYEKLKYCDYMYGKEEFTDEVWEYVDEINEYGRKAFYEEYKDYKLY